MTETTPPTVEQVLSALRYVIDPEIGLDIVTLGLVYGVAVEGDAADITFSLTTRGCPMEHAIRGGILQAVARVPGVGTVRPHLVWEPPWHPGMVEPGDPMIKTTDRIDEVLARDPRLMAVLAQASPTFARLGRDELPKPMARLVTVEQAARVAGLDPAELLARLNHAVAHPDRAPLPPSAASTASTASTDAAARAPIPEALLRIPADRVVECDVREDLRSGKEPFGRIMAAARDTPAGGLLKVRATFEPAPLYAVLGKQGFSHTVERLADDDWRIWFHRQAATDAAASAPAVSAEAPASADADTDVIVLDVRGLEPPEPMVRTLEALADMPAGKTLVQINVRVPRFLLPTLEERGFTYEVREQSADLVRLFIRHTQP